MKDKIKIKLKLSPHGRFISLIFALSCIIYASQNRKLSDFLLNSGKIILVIYSIIFIALFFIVKKTKNFSFPKKLIIALLLIVALGPIYYSIGVVINDVYLYVKSPTISRNWSAFITVFSILILGLLLFYVRLKFRCVYGISEAAVGIFIAMHKVIFIEPSDLLTSEFYIAILTASIFLVVRGFDNIYVGLTKELDPVAQKFLAIFEK
ncbi:hypothetical protein [Flavobacterium microcysteis]|uniref:Uncharacterized protein n=1 Tax=Flavobacterium microcysteis TaxID=2596891 RepID=A0A501QEL5_9FLAO|nr:hypothetical protein [Flavobacterium microcysteis]TPD71270.1 hypothetical protein FJA49_05050 [Flavobacterium microcysteis]